jgi:hypothetical protein
MYIVVSYGSLKQCQTSCKSNYVAKRPSIGCKDLHRRVSSTQHPLIMWGHSSSLCSNTQKRIQWVPQKITCIGVTARVLLKNMSFILNQIDQHKAYAPTRILYINFLLIPFSHVQCSQVVVDGVYSYQSSYGFASGQIPRRSQGTLLPLSGEPKVSNPWNNVQRKDSI